MELEPHGMGGGHLPRGHGEAWPPPARVGDGAPPAPPAASRLLGVAVLDAEGRVLEASGGLPEPDADGGPLRWDDLVPPRYAPAISRALWEAYLRGTSPRFDKDWVREDGVHLPVCISLQPLGAGGRHLALVQDLSHEHHAERMLRFLSEASRLLARRPGNARAGLLRVSRLAIASVADSFQAFLLHPDGRLRCEVCAHHHPEHEALLRGQPPPPHVPGLDAQLAQVFPSSQARPYAALPPLIQVQLVPDARARTRLTGNGARHVPGPEARKPPALLAVPLRCGGRVLGVLLLSPGGPDAPAGALDVATAGELGLRVTMALDNARLLRELKQAERRARFLAEAGQLFSGSLEPATTFEAVVRLAVPVLADWCAVDLLEEGRIRRVAVAHREPEKVALAWEIERRWPFRREDGYGPARVIRTGLPELHEDLPDAGLVRAARDAEHLRALRSLGLHSYVIAPLRARGHTLGAITLVHAESGRRFQPQDLRMATELADRAALAADNARLYQASQQAVRVRDGFLAVASHELKGPLTPFQLRLQALERETRGPRPMDVERVRSHLKVLRRQTRRLATLVESLLDVSRVEAGTLQLDLEDVDLDAVVREVAARFEGQAARASSRLDVKPGGPLVGRWDRSRLEQVVTHLLANALKYGAGRPVHVRTCREGTWAKLTVSDEGIGIEPRALPRIFDRFERAVSEEHFGGLGLGLYLSRALVEALGGTIHADSQPGHGATFDVRLPLPQES